MVISVNKRKQRSLTIIHFYFQHTKNWTIIASGTEPNVPIFQQHFKKKKKRDKQNKPLLSGPSTHTSTQSAVYVAPAEGWVIYWYNIGKGRDFGTVQHTELHSGNANRTSMNHGGIREALGGPCVPLLLRAAEGLSLLTAAEIWREQPSWVQTDSLAGPLAGLQKTPGGRTCANVPVCMCVCVHSIEDTAQTHTLVSTSVALPKPLKSGSRIKVTSMWVLIGAGVLGLKDWHPRGLDWAGASSSSSS